MDKKGAAMTKRTRWLRITLFSALSFLLMLIAFPVPIFPLFLKMDFSDLPALFAALSMGPLSGVAVELIKNILHAFLAGHTAFIGETANFLVGISFILPFSFFHGKRYSPLKTLAAGTAAACVMSFSAGFLNYFVFLPLYEKALGIPVSTVIKMAASVNRYVIDKKSLILWSIVPFNLLKGIILTLALFFIYKKMRTWLEGPAEPGPRH